MQSFIETGLRPELVAAVDDLGFEQPTPIQQQAIPFVLGRERDLIALAQTGTGKTAAFGLPLLQDIQPELGGVQAIVLCPTRELAIQIFKDFTDYGRYVPGLKLSAVYGGADIRKQMREIKKGAQVVVGTPGRVLDLVRRGALKLSGVQRLVLDEADEMLNMGFQEDLDEILATTPKEKQTLLFSATMPKEVARIAQRYMHQPGEIAVGTKNRGAENIIHRFYVANGKNRYAAMRRVIDSEPDIFAIVFCRTKKETLGVAESLVRDGYRAEAINGDLSQPQRDAVMGRFRTGKLQLMVATDVAARGLDIDALTHVINYQLPDDPEVYVHRSGRTGRAGASGVAISFVDPREVKKVRDIERMLGKGLEKSAIPGGQEVLKGRLKHRLDTLLTTDINEAALAPFLQDLGPRFEDLDRETLIKKLLSRELEQLPADYQDAPDLNAGGKRKKKAVSNADFSTFRLNIGYAHNMHPARIMGILNDEIGDRDMQIGRIEITKRCSFVEVESRFTKEMMSRFHQTVVEGVDLTIEPAQTPPREKKKSFGSKPRKKTPFYEGRRRRR